MALSRRARLALGGTVLAGAAALTTTGMAFAAADQPTLRITEPVDDVRNTGVADGSGGCDTGGGTGGTGPSGSAASEQ